MATQQYMNNRKRYSRPQAVLFADQAPIFVSGRAVPPGFEIASAGYNPLPEDENGFIILSDHNRAPISMSSTRFENRQRMINAQLRSFYINEKVTIELSWDMLPSRSFKTRPDFSQITGKPDVITTKSVDRDRNPVTPNTSAKIDSQGSLYESDQQYTVDGGAGGAEILAWYENHRGPFWVYLAYDNFAIYGYDDEDYAKLANYTDFYYVYITSFSYSIQKRGANNFDMWSISLTLEEV